MVHVSNDVGLTKAGPRAVFPGKSTRGGPALLNPCFRGSPDVPSLGEGVTCAAGNHLSSGGHSSAARADACSARLWGGKGDTEEKARPAPSVPTTWTWWDSDTGNRWFLKVSQVTQGEPWEQGGGT